MNNPAGGFLLLNPGAGDFAVGFVDGSSDDGDGVSDVRRSI